MKYLIIGSLKCGQTSLQVYLEEQGHEVEKIECFTHPNGPELIKNVKYDKLAVIFRDPIERIWSQYLYLRFKGTLKEYLDLYRADSVWGNENPLWISNYKLHLKRWKNLEIFHLEEMKKLPNFPHRNITKNILKYKELSAYDRKYIVDSMNKHNECFE